MQIKVAKNAGFCFGVKRAVDTLLKQAESQSLVTLGPIIHNDAVIRRLESLGIRMVDHISDAPKGAAIAIRTHGVPKAVLMELEKNNIPYVDLTCPYVKKIHDIVDRHYKAGYQIVIAGDQHHPEVDGIDGWCENSAVIAADPADLEGKLHPDDKVCLVSQTTMDRESFEKIKKFLKSYCQNLLIFDTICKATKTRQEESMEIAKQSDAMLVVGGRLSANTKRLYDLCKSCCGQTFQIESYEEIPHSLYMPKINIGITAGASTPPWIIKEVIGEMEEILRDGNEVSFAEALEAHEKEQALVTLKSGDIVKGTVMRVEQNGVSVNLGYKSDGFIPASEVIDEPEANIADIIHVGDVIDVFVVRVNDVEGEVTLSKRKIDAIQSEKHLEEAMENNETLTGKVVDVVNGGVLVACKGGRVFIPASLASDRYLSDLSVLANKEVQFRIIEITKKRGRNKVVGSIKAVLKEQKQKLAEEFWANVEVGKSYKGIVKSLTKFGAFVDVGGVDGLVHISELSWAKIKHPSEVVSEGDCVEVYVLDVDKEKGKVSLGYKKQEDNPWEKAKAELAVGKDIPCKIVRIVPFGAFAEIFPGVDGLIHISQVADRRIGKVEDELTVGQHVTARVVDLDLDNQKIGLSIRAILEEKKAKEEAEILAEDAAAQEVAAQEVAAQETAVEETAVQEAEAQADEPIAEAVEAAEETETAEAAEQTEE